MIHVDLGDETWSFDNGGSMRPGGNDGSLFVMPQSTIPDDPALPGIGTLGDLIDSVVVGSADGSVRTVRASNNAQLLPVLDSHAPPAGASWSPSENTGAHPPARLTLSGLRLTTPHDARVASVRARVASLRDGASQPASRSAACAALASSPGTEHESSTLATATVRSAGGFCACSPAPTASCSTYSSPPPELEGSSQRPVSARPAPRG